LHKNKRKEKKQAAKHFFFNGIPPIFYFFKGNILSKYSILFPEKFHQISKKN
jgi:hypothetical protein